MLARHKKSEFLDSFKRSLVSFGVSKNTLRNYHSDLGIFTKWLTSRLNALGIDSQSFDEAVPFLSNSYASEFKDFLAGQNHSEKTINRRLSSLRALSRFLVESQICDFDFMEGVSNIGTEPKQELSHPTLIHFQKHLESQKVSKNTIKNYVSDVKHFLDWLKTNQKHAQSQ